MWLTGDIIIFADAVREKNTAEARNGKTLKIQVFRDMNLDN